MQWLNEPPQWQQDGAKLTITTAPKTDFWRKTHYGFIRDSGHLYYEEVHGDFSFETVVQGQYAALYDQAGLMLYVNEENWMKCGIEFFEERQHASCVVTRDYSDWSVVPLLDPPSLLKLRVTRQGSTIEVHYALGKEANHTLLRLAYLPMPDAVKMGLMAASPEGPGFTVTFDGWNLNRL